MRTFRTCHNHRSPSTSEEQKQPQTKRISIRLTKLVYPCAIQFVILSLCFRLICMTYTGSSELQRAKTDLPTGAANEDSNQTRQRINCYIYTIHFAKLWIMAKKLEWFFWILLKRSTGSGIRGYCINLKP